MKIKQTRLDYDQAIMKMQKCDKKPVKPNLFFRTLLRVVSEPELKKVHFSYETFGMEKLSKNEPCLILMNHSGFIDLKIAEKVFADRPINIICTSDGFVGKEWLMRHIGCIPAYKFVNDVPLVKNMVYALRKLGSSVLMYPEASYSFDGTETPLPDSLGKCIKLLNVPVIMVRTYGAFARNPLYNNLQNRKCDVRADVTYLLSPKEIKEKSARELNEIVKEAFSFDNFKWQQQNGIKIKEKFRADSLNRVLYKCPNCLKEGNMEGKGTKLICNACHKEYELTEDGFMKALSGETEFAHIPDWYKWERECVWQEILDGTYLLDTKVDIAVMVNFKSIYHVGEGRLRHDLEGFTLTGCDGKLNYHQNVKSAYSLYADYFWYEIGDVICIGNHDISYYCFPKESGDIVAKTRIATELLYQQLKKVL